jgi:hypothetical protein
MLQLFSPQLLNGLYHDQLGALYSNAQTAEIFGCETTTIRSQKKRLSDQGELVEGKHWIASEDGKTYWSFEGTCLLGLTLSTQLAQQFRLGITEMLRAWQAGELSIVPSGNGVTIQSQQGALQVATLELPDPVAVGEAIAQARYNREVEAWKGSVAAVVQGKEEELRSNITDCLGKYLESAWGVNPL